MEPMEDQVMTQKRIAGFVAVIALLAGDAGAAMLYVTNPATGGSTLDLAAGETGDMSLMLTIRDIDTGFAFLNTFYDDDDNANDGIIEVIEWAPGFDGRDVIYSETGQWLPYDISWDVNNEYALIMGRIDGKNWGPGTYLIDTLTLLVDGIPTQDTVPVTFEEGARAPQLFTADFTQFPWDTGLDGIQPDYLDPGVGGATDPFIINLIPEPATLIVVVMGALATLRRRDRR